MSTTPRADWVLAALAEYERGLLSYATRLTGDVERARDAVQETFLELCSQDGAELRPRLREWLFTVCRNKAIDMRRKESRMNARNTSLETAPHSEPSADPSEEPHEALERRDTLSHVLESLRSLPEAQQEVLVLKFRHGLAYREIARVTGHTVSNVGYLIHMGVKALRARHALDLQEGCA